MFAGWIVVVLGTVLAGAVTVSPPPTLPQGDVRKSTVVSRCVDTTFTGVGEAGGTATLATTFTGKGHRSKRWVVKRQSYSVRNVPEGVTVSGYVLTPKTRKSMLGSTVRSGDVLRYLLLWDVSGVDGSSAGCTITVRVP